MTNTLRNGQRHDAQGSAPRRRAASRWAARVVLAALVAPALSAPSLSAETHSWGAELVTRLLDERPRSMRALEAVVGPLQPEGAMPLLRERATGPLTMIAVMPVLDLYRPSGSDPALETWELTFQYGCEELLALLEARLGAPEPVADQLRFGDFYWLDRSGVLCDVAWHARPPEWAKPTRSAAETLAAERAVVRFLTEGRFTRAGVEAAFGPLQHDADWNYDRVTHPTWGVYTEPGGVQTPRRIVIHFDSDRSLPATAPLLAALNIRAPVVISRDVHAVMRLLAERSTLRLPRVHGHGIKVHVDRDHLTMLALEELGQLAWRADPLHVVSIEVLLRHR